MRKIVPVVLICYLGFFCCLIQAAEIVFNPYEGILWDKIIQHKANLHTHTTASDGKYHPHQIVDRYRQLGYTILAITDHDYQNLNKNRITYPWERFSEMLNSKGETGLYENRFPGKMGMLAIGGNELSEHHHIGSYLCDFEGSKEVEHSLKAITDRNGIAIIFHPGRYRRSYPLEWYLDLFKKFQVLAGIEVYNQGNRYPEDRTMWDTVLIKLMPERPVWGFSNDDAHTSAHIGRNWNIFLIQKLSETDFREAMKKGKFYFGYSPDAAEGKFAVIKSITVDKRKGTITIEASDCERIEWISKGKVIHTGNTINYRQNQEISGYLRATLYGIDGKSITEIQPFGFSKN